MLIINYCDQNMPHDALFEVVMGMHINDIIYQKYDTDVTS